MLPSSLSHFYESRTQLAQRQRSEVWLVNDRASGADCVVKLSELGHQPDELVLAALVGRPQARTCLALPSERGFTDDGRYYQLLPYFPDRDLSVRLGQQDLPDATRSAECRSFVSQIATALTVIHQPDSKGRRIVHGDLKPSNILLDIDPIGNSAYLLADFDAAHFEDSPGRRYTVCYAAPEVIGGTRNQAADWWSLGMVVLEWLSGSSPFAGLDETGIRRRLVTDWVPDAGVIAGEEWRALLLGLLDRSPTTRWGPDDIRRWLEGDPDTIRSGLARGGESRATEPFVVQGTPVFSARSLASALIRTWATGLLQDDQLPSWIETRLERPDMAAHVRSLLADASLAQDVKLLRLCFHLNSELPPIWRSHPLTGENLDAIASQAQRGNADSLVWLRSLLDGQCFDFYRSRGDTQPAQLGEELVRAWNDYQAAWGEIAAAGAPPLQPPAEDDALPMVVRATFSSEVAAELRHYAERLSADPMLLFGENWIRCFGTPLTVVSPSRLLVLRQFIPVVPEMITAADIPSPARAGNEEILVWDRSQQRLWSWFRVQPGTDVINLQPGQTFPHRSNYRPIQHWDATRTAVGQSILRFLRGARNSFLRRLGRQPITDVPEIAPEFRVKLLELAAIETAHLENAPPLAQAYLALISWNSPQHRHLELRIADMGTFLPSGRLKSPPLPARGRYLIVLTGNTRIRFSVRRRWFSMGQHSRPISVWFHEPTPMLDVSKEIMLGVRDKLIDLGTQSLVLPIDELTAAEKIMSSHSKILTEAGDFDPERPDWRTALLPARRQPPIS